MQTTWCFKEDGDVVLEIWTLCSKVEWLKQCGYTHLVLRKVMLSEFSMPWVKKQCHWWHYIVDFVPSVH